MSKVSFNGNLLNTGELRKWLKRTQNTLDALKEASVVDGNVNLNDIKTLIKNIVSYMDKKSTDDVENGVCNKVQQLGIAIVEELMKWNDDVFRFVVDDCEEFHRDDSWRNGKSIIMFWVPELAVIVCKNLCTNDARKHASVATYKATCEILALLCQNKPDVIRNISDFLLLKDQEGRSLMNVLESKMHNPEQGESTRNLLEKLRLLRHFTDKQEESRRASLKRNYDAVIKDLKNDEDIETHVAEVLYLLKCRRAMYQPKQA